MGEKMKFPSNPFTKHIPEEALQHAQAARQEMRKSAEALLPPEFLARRHAARKEMLMAARSLIDAALNRFEDQ